LPVAKGIDKVSGYFFISETAEIGLKKETKMGEFDSKTRKIYYVAGRIGEDTNPQLILSDKKRILEDGREVIRNMYSLSLNILSSYKPMK